MSVGWLLVIHHCLNDELLKAATATLNGCPMATQVAG
jgi:hypothetical protein